MLRLIVLTALLLPVHSVAEGRKVCTGLPAAPLTDDTFQDVIETIAASWNAGRGAVAAKCFDNQALYLEPPDRQVYRGRKAIAEFFESSVNSPLSDRMTWHHAAFNPTTQVGFAEYTYRGGRYYHGVVVIAFRDGLITSWREYQYGSTMPWEEFVVPRQ